jgi:hypothetical protein
MRRVLYAIVACMMTGCGPMVIPMIERLDDQDQAEVDEMWENMLTPAKRLDRQTLLDVLIMQMLYQRGGDQFVARAEKQTSHATVLMEISFDRLHPERDAFTVTMSDPVGREIRRETYAPDEIKQAVEELFGGPRTLVPDQAAEDPQVIHEAQVREAQRGERLERARAATRPAAAPGV